jgi:hypothetical protein
MGNICRLDVIICQDSMSSVVSNAFWLTPKGVVLLKREQESVIWIEKATKC